jgi:hypothetical protein
MMGRAPGEERTVTSADLLDDVVASDPAGLHEQALRRLKKRRELKTHAFAYVVINVVVWAIWAVIAATSGATFPWPLWLTLGWGIGLAFNVWDVYFRRPITEAEIRHEMDRLRSEQTR